MDQPTPEWAKDPRNAFIEADGLERVDNALRAVYDDQTREHILKPIRAELAAARAAKGPYCSWCGARNCRFDHTEEHKKTVLADK